MFSIFVRASRLFLSAAFHPKVGQNFLPTGELGTFFRLAVFLGIVWYCMVLCYCNISMCFHPVLARQLLPLRLNALGLHLPSDPKGCTLAKLTIHLDQNTGVAGVDSAKTHRR